MINYFLVEIEWKVEFNSIRRLNFAEFVNNFIRNKNQVFYFFFSTSKDIWTVIWRGLFNS